ncbi:uncharacterized protein LOC107044449 isoform X2 [Diachasma alloeum]|nr:uncharacterized protein LOC107044449 isoform X2 [Diachasma alloeum]
MDNEGEGNNAPVFYTGISSISVSHISSNTRDPEINDNKMADRVDKMAANSSTSPPRSITSTSEPERHTKDSQSVSLIAEKLKKLENKMADSPNDKFPPGRNDVNARTVREVIDGDEKLKAGNSKMAAARDKMADKSTGLEGKKSEKITGARDKDEFRLLSAEFGVPLTQEQIYRRTLKKVKWPKPEWRRSSEIPFALDPRRIKQLKRECMEELLKKTPVVDGDQVKVEAPAETILPEELPMPVVMDTTEGKEEEKIGLDREDEATMGENVVSSSDSSHSSEQWDRCSSEVDEGIASSQSTPSSSPNHIPDTTVASSKPVPELLDESTGSPTERFARRSIKLTCRPLPPSVDLSDIETCPSGSSSPSSNEKLPTESNLNSDTNKSPSITDNPRDFFVQGENLKTVLSNHQPPSSPSDSPASPTGCSKSRKNSTLETSQDIAQTTLSASNSPKFSEKGSKMSSPKDSDARRHLLDILEGSDPSPELSETAQNSSKSDKASDSSPNSRENPKKPHKSHKSSSKDRSEKSSKKRHRSDDRKSSKSDESNKKPKKSDNSSSKRRSDHSPSGGSSSEDPSKRRRKSSTSSSKSSRSSKEKTRESEESKPSEPSNSDSNPKKPTQIGSSKRPRVSRLSSEAPATESPSNIPEDLQKKLNCVKSKSEPKKSKRNSEEIQKNLSRLFGQEGAPSTRPSEDDSAPPGGHPAPEPPCEPQNSQPAQKDSEPAQDEGLDCEEEIAKIWLAVESGKPNPSKKSTSTSRAGDYLQRKRLRLEKENQELEKKILSEIPKPASAVRPRNRAPLPLKPSVVPPPPDPEELNANVPIDEEIFHELEDEPVPLIEAVEKALEGPPKAENIPLIGDGSVELSQGSEPMDIDESEGLPDVKSPHSVDTVILDEGSRSPGRLEIDEKANSLGEFKEASPPQTLKISYKVGDSDEEKTLEVSPGGSFLNGPERNWTPSILENLMENRVDSDDALKTLEEMCARPLEDLLPQDGGEKVDVGLTPEEINEVARRKFREFSVATRGGNRIIPRIVSSPMGEMVAVPVGEPAHPSLRGYHRAQEQLFEDVIGMMRVFQYRMEVVERHPGNVEMVRLLNSVCAGVREGFTKLRATMEGVVDEEVVRLIVERSRRTNETPFVRAEEIVWALRRSKVAVAEPVPAPVVPAAVGRAKEEEKKTVRRRCQEGGRSASSGGYSGGGVIHQTTDAHHPSARPPPPPPYPGNHQPVHPPQTSSAPPQTPQIRPKILTHPKPELLPRPMPQFHPQSLFPTPQNPSYPQILPFTPQNPKKKSSNSQLPSKFPPQPSQQPPPLSQQPFPPQPHPPRVSNPPAFPQHIAIIQMQQYNQYTLQTGNQALEVQPQGHPQPMNPQYMPQQQLLHQMNQQNPLLGVPQPHPIPQSQFLPPEFVRCASGQCNHNNCETRLQVLRHHEMLQQSKNAVYGVQSRDPRSRGHPQQMQVNPPGMMSQGQMPGAQPSRSHHQACGVPGVYPGQVPHQHQGQLQHQQINPQNIQLQNHLLSLDQNMSHYLDARLVENYFETIESTHQVPQKTQKARKPPQGPTPQRAQQLQNQVQQPQMGLQHPLNFPIQQYQVSQHSYPSLNPQMPSPQQNYPSSNCHMPSQNIIYSPILQNSPAQGPATITRVKTEPTTQMNLLQKPPSEGILVPGAPATDGNQASSRPCYPLSQQSYPSSSPQMPLPQQNHPSSHLQVPSQNLIYTQLLQNSPAQLPATITRVKTEPKSQTVPPQNSPSAEGIPVAGTPVTAGNQAGANDRITGVAKFNHLQIPQSSPAQSSITITRVTPEFRAQMNFPQKPPSSAGIPMSGTPITGVNQSGVNVGLKSPSGVNSSGISAAIGQQTGVTGVPRSFPGMNSQGMPPSGHQAGGMGVLRSSPGMNSPGIPVGGLQTGVIGVPKSIAGSNSQAGGINIARSSPGQNSPGIPGTGPQSEMTRVPRPSPSLDSGISTSIRPQVGGNSAETPVTGAVGVPRSFPGVNSYGIPLGAHTGGRSIPRSPGMNSPGTPAPVQQAGITRVSRPSPSLDFVIPTSVGHQIGVNSAGISRSSPGIPTTTIYPGGIRASPLSPRLNSPGSPQNSSRIIPTKIAQFSGSQPGFIPKFTPVVSSQGVPLIPGNESAVTGAPRTSPAMTSPRMPTPVQQTGHNSTGISSFAGVTGGSSFYSDTQEALAAMERIRVTAIDDFRTSTRASTNSRIIIQTPQDQSPPLESPKEGTTAPQATRISPEISGVISSVQNHSNDSKIPTPAHENASIDHQSRTIPTPRDGTATPQDTRISPATPEVISPAKNHFTTPRIPTPAHENPSIDHQSRTIPTPRDGTATPHDRGVFSLTKNHSSAPRIPTPAHENASIDIHSRIIPASDVSPASPGSPRSPLDLSTKPSSRLSKPVIISDIKISPPKSEITNSPESKIPPRNSPAPGCQGRKTSQTPEEIPLISLDSSDDEEFPESVGGSTGISGEIPEEMDESDASDGDLEIIDQLKGSFSLVDDEIECDGMAREMGIHLETPSQKFEEVALKIAGVTSIPIDQYEGIEEAQERVAERVVVKEEWMEAVEDINVQDEKPKICLVCKTEVATLSCKFCRLVLVCGEACGERTDHFDSCGPPLVKIEDE